MGEELSAEKGGAAAKAAQIFRNGGIKRVLDVGCGTGVDSLYLSKNGLAVHGIDFSKSAIEKARENERENLSFECASILGMIIPDESFEGVYCGKLLHLLQKEEREEAVEKLHGTLKKGGTAVFAVLSDEDEGYGMGEEVEEGTFRREDGHTTHYFSREEIAGLLSKHGFRGIKTEKEESAETRHKFLIISAKKEKH